MKSLAEYLRGEQQQRESEKSRVLSELKAALQPYVELAKSELPKIESALLEADLWIKENLSVAPSREWPDSLQRHVFNLEGPRGNPAVIRAALKELDQLTEGDCWGKRADGERDVNRVAVLREDFRYRLQVANGCARSIKKTLGYIKSEAAKFQEQIEYQRMIEGNGVKPAMITTPVKTQPTESIPTRTDFDPRRVD